MEKKKIKRKNKKTENYNFSRRSYKKIHNADIIKQ